MLAGWQTALLRISASRRVTGEYVARLFSEDREGDYKPAAETRFQLDVATWRTGFFTGPGELVGPLTHDPHFAEAVESLLSGLRNCLLLLDIRSPSLSAASWETLTWSLPFGSGWVGPYARPVIRYSPELASLALVALELPADVVVAEAQGWAGPPTDDFVHPLKHFRSVIANRLDHQRIRTVLASTNHDIAHLRGSAFWREGAARFGVANVGDSLDARELRRLMMSGPSPARLVILETDWVSLPAMTALAHGIAGRDGPAVLVTPWSSMNFRDLYYGITHNSSLIEVWLNNRTAQSSGTPAAFYLARGGELALNLTQAASDLKDRLRIQLARVNAALSYVDAAGLVAHPQAERSNLEERKGTLSATASRLEGILGSSYMYDHESEGLDPMTAATVEFERVVEELDNSGTAAGRVVNTWFSRAGIPLSPRDSLDPGETYRLEVSVGPRNRQSNLIEPEVIPESALEPLYEASGLTLGVVIFSSDFVLHETRTILALPRPPATSSPVSFIVDAPREPGRATLRVALYYQNNLLQSLIVTAQVGPVGASRNGFGNFGTVDWVLSGSLSELDRFGEKTLNILTNQTPTGTHLFGVVGTDLEQQIEFGEEEMTGKVRRAREALQWVCGDSQKGEDYRYEANNIGDETRFTEFIAGLAEYGYDLYVDLVESQDDDFEDRLNAKLASKATIQVAHTKSAKHSFPWALVYDHRLVPHPTNTTCPDFLASLARRPTAQKLASTSCLSTGCAYREDTNVVCPSGFWGFRHVIEQPLSPIGDTGVMPLIGSEAADVVVDGRALLAYSRNLTRYQDHLREVGEIVGPGARESSSLFDIGLQMKRPDLQLIYFYCHGGNRRGKAWIGVGFRPPEELFASDFHAWGVKWTEVRPLVFLNGCNTVGVSPDDLLTFTGSLARANAAGVLGWEITIPETLGRQFGVDFLKGFLNREPIGELVRNLRLSLLAGYNPLGLAYTPYCLAKLHLA
jgi:hypothetical protein